MTGNILSLGNGATIAYDPASFTQSNYEIAETHSPYGTANITLEVKGLYSLPDALKRLVEMGHDLSASLEALQHAVAAQQKRKALDEAVADLKS